MDYYKILQVPRDCTDTDIKKAFRKLAVFWHPDKNANQVELAEERFSQVAEGYEVLSDPQRRAIFDQYGEVGLKKGIPNGRGGTTGGWDFNRNPDEMFADFFGNSSPFADFFNSDTGAPLLTQPQDQKAPKAPPAQANMYCSLEELYQGCTKKMKITRRRLNPDGRTTTTEERVMTVNVRPGWKANTKITFPGEGDESADAPAADVQFVLKEKPHPRFSRRGNDLVFKATLSLADALCGSTVYVSTLDGRTLPIAVNDVVKPGSSKTVAGEGMPLSKNPAKKGNLVIEFDLVFPATISEKQKAAIRQILP